MNSRRELETIYTRIHGNVCFIEFKRPESGNMIDKNLILELSSVLDGCEGQVSIIVIKGSAEVFCLGADFTEVAALHQQGHNVHGERIPDPRQQEALFELWSRLRCGPYITVAQVRGRVNAGGVGFAAACDIVIADESAAFSLSELLFGLMPACVLPFLLRRIGWQRSHYMTLSTKPVLAHQAAEWGLIDILDEDSDSALRMQLARLRRLSMVAIRRYKDYSAQLSSLHIDEKELALKSNRLVFSDPRNLEGIVRYVERGLFPWEGGGGH